ncbi:hypothetical protein ElP_43360 [Tautonia plasticadhaerens]|uniref:Uncharacterized protein n=1 Tax=Tautonia plasticadhaerens TaxID=2527974 RepID=A0A518H6E4_9BACT|nr:hypothetical protein ElP_43360 [Tautonia plasticadhaerens]
MLLGSEAEWRSCTDPFRMLDTLRGKASDRKFRLFAAACYRRLAELLPDPRQRRGIEVIEAMAEGTVAEADRRRVMVEVRRAIPPDDWEARIDGAAPSDHPHYVALMLYREFCSSSTAVHAVHASAGMADGDRERHEQSRLMRCIFGNPFRSPALDPTWLTPDVVSLAGTIYDERAFDLMPILGDALAAAGCADDDLQGHCRLPGEHARGCWVVDAILGKS